MSVTTRQAVPIAMERACQALVMCQKESPRSAGSPFTIGVLIAAQ
jgi:hypothetical protein